MGRKRTWWILAALAVVSLTAVPVGGIWMFQRKLVFPADQSDPVSAKGHFPDASDITIMTEDGVELAAWLVHPLQANGKAILFLHGNAGNRGGHELAGEVLAAAGYTVLIPDYRGYGGNSGSPSETGLLVDAVASMGHLNALGFSDGEVVIVAESIGTGVGVQLAAVRDPLAVLLRSPFTSLEDVVRKTLRLPLGPLLRDRFESSRWITGVKAPVTILAGSDDNIVPAELSIALAELTPTLHRLEVLPGKGHNDEFWLGKILVDHVEDLVGLETNASTI